jgi:hypothetical protein
VVKSYKPKRKWVEAIEELESWLRTPEGAAELCTAIGLTADPAVSAAWGTLVELDEAVDRELLQELIELEPDDAAATTALLRSMQVFDFDEGRFAAEPTAARAWRTMDRARASDAAG